MKELATNTNAYAQAQGAGKGGVESGWTQLSMRYEYTSEFSFKWVSFNSQHLGLLEDVQRVPPSQIHPLHDFHPFSPDQELLPRLATLGTQQQ